MNLVFQFPDFQSFMWMDGHGPYVWGCYGATFLALAFLVVEPVMQRKRLIKRQQGLLARNAKSKSEE